MDAEDSILNRDELDLIFFDEYFPEEHGAEDFLGLLGKAVPASSAAGAVASAPAAASAEPALSAESAPKRKKASPAATALSSPDEHRREINRRNARKTRLRKKFKMEGLLVRHAQLEEENRLLRSALEGSGVKPPPRKAPHDFEVPADDTSGAFSAFSQGQILPRDQAMISALSLGCSNFILTNPALPDNPICFVSPGFLQMSGYTKEEVVGRCVFARETAGRAALTRPWRRTATAGSCRPPRRTKPRTRRSATASATRRTWP
jgi:PAS domain-containing protein